MAYLGRQPLVGNYQVLDALVATTTDTYALTKDTVAVFPQTPSNCIVSLNGVIQAPTDSYTISGSDIVFASALTGSDSIDFITVLGDVLSIGTPTDGTVSLAKLSATGTKDATTFLRGDNTFQTIGTNTPAFEAYLGSAQTVTDNTITKVSIDTELFDTNGYYDAVTNYRFTPLVAGKYFVYGSIECDTSTGTVSAIDSVDSLIYKNGSLYARTVNTFNDNPIRMAYLEVSAVVELNGSTDYVEFYGRINVNTGTPLFEPDTAWDKATKFGAYKIIE
jgi:hypothetical protein